MKLLGAGVPQISAEKCCNLACDYSTGCAEYQLYEIFGTPARTRQLPSRRLGLFCLDFLVKEQSREILDYEASFVALTTGSAGTG